MRRDEPWLLEQLLKAVVGEQSEFVIRPFLPGLKKLASFAYVAERHGYRYAGHAPGTAALNNPGFVFRREADARERAALLTAGRPGGGIALPGMMPGRGLMPTPAGQTEVDLLHSRMVVDACGRYRPRVLSNLLLFPFAAALFLAFPGYTGKRVLIAAGTWLTFIVLYLLGLLVTRYRRARHLARLRAAGELWPPSAAA